MAEPSVERVVAGVVRFVEGDTGLRCAATTDELVAGLTDGDLRVLGLLGDNLDIPARLAPSTEEVLARDRWRLDPNDLEPSDHTFEEPWDDRRAARALLTIVTARVADRLRPGEGVPEPAGQAQRDRLGWAVSRAYAESVAPRLPESLFTDGKPGDLGLFAPPVLEGDVAAARSLAFAVGVRFDQRDSDVLRELVAAGRGGAAPVIAKKMLERNPGFATLPAAEKASVVRQAAQELEANFASRDPRETKERELTEEVENRRDDIAGGALAVDDMNSWAGAQIDKLHAAVDEHQAIEQPEQAGTLYEQVRWIQLAVHELTGTHQSLWNETIPEPGQAVPVPDYSLRLTRDEALALRDLTADGADGPLPAGQVPVARQAVQKVATQYARLAVPYGYDRRNEAAVQAVAPQFLALQDAVTNALGEDHLNEIIDRAVPPQYADQLRTTEPAYRDTDQAPAARAFAQAVDAARGTEFPNETLRRMAGQGRAGIAIAAAHRLVEGSTIDPGERRFAVRLIAADVDKHFDRLPAQVEVWRDGGYSVLADREVDDAAGYGEYVARLSLEMVSIFEEDPGSARRESRDLDRQAGTTRFAPGADPAATPFASVKPATTAPAATNRTATEQTTDRTIDR
ncbi:hypothetical protein [Kribbella sp. NPDC004536]|uniref:hypothetical protein n=1 Tax=Kribbella sp. NPDC004536 TaxID=3364106 RepID=UPI0036BF92B7